MESFDIFLIFISVELGYIYYIITKKIRNCLCVFIDEHSDG